MKNNYEYTDQPYRNMTNSLSINTVKQKVIPYDCDIDDIIWYFHLKDGFHN